MKIEAAALAALDARLDPTSPAPLAIAVSGGGDSMALLHLAGVWAARHGRPLLVLTVDHELNAASPGWARFVVERAASLGHQTRLLRWSGAKPQSGLAAAARGARHALLAEAAREAGARVLLLGHTQDDVLESQWMRADGSTLGRLRAWSPSPAWPEGRAVTVFRPLLALSRAELRAWLRSCGLSWLEDPANADLRSPRARARLALAGSFGSAHQADAEAEEQGAQYSVGDLPELERVPGVLAIPRDRFEQRGPCAHRLLSAAIVCASGGVRPPRGGSVARLLARLEERANPIATLGGARLRSSKGEVLIGRDLGRTGLPQLHISAGETLVWDGRFEISAERDGIIRPVAGCASRLSKPDREALRDLPPWVRPTLPVLESPTGAARLAPARSLMGRRLLAAAGAYLREADLPGDGADRPGFSVAG